MKTALSVKEAAPLLGMSEEYLRDLMRFGLINVGEAYKLPGKKKFHYIIYPERLNEYLTRGEKC